MLDIWLVIANLRPAEKKVLDKFITWSKQMPATDGAVGNTAAENLPGSYANHFSLTGMSYL